MAEKQKEREEEERSCLDYNTLWVLYLVDVSNDINREK